MLIFVAACLSLKPGAGRYIPRTSDDRREADMLGRVLGYTFYAVAALLLLSGLLALGGGLADSAVSSAGLSLTVAVELAVAGGFYWWGRRLANRGQGSSRRAEQLVAQTQAFFAEVNARGAFEAVPTRRFLSTPAKPALLAGSAKLYEFKSRRVSNHAGTRLKFGNLPLVVGQSTARTYSDLEATASGELVLTAHSLVFNGDQRSIELKLESINGVELQLDGFTVSSAARQKPVSFTIDNPLLWVQLLKNLSMFKPDGLALLEGQALRAL